MELPKLKARNHDASLSTMLVSEDGSLIVAECSGMYRTLTAGEIARRCNLHQELIDVLGEIVGQEKPNSWGYDSSVVAMNDVWRNKARALWAKSVKGDHK